LLALLRAYRLLMAKRRLPLHIGDPSVDIPSHENRTANDEEIALFGGHGITSRAKRCSWGCPARA
jgi:hypothetical protein